MGQIQNKNMRKKGEVTTKQIITIIILIVSFAVILYFILRLNPTATTNKEICRNSVVLQSKSLNLGGSSLDCKTNYVCISGGGNCEGMIEDVVRINHEDKNEIFKAIANEMADCWWMFGEGKLNYITGRTFTGNVGCAVCSTIEFDEKIRESYEREEINYRELLEFLEKTKISSDETYLSYLTSYSDLDILVDDFGDVFRNYLDKSISFDKKYIIQTAQIRASGIIRFFDNWRLGDYDVVPPFLYEIGESPIGTRGCDEYVTKA